MHIFWQIIKLFKKIFKYKYYKININCSMWNIYLYKANLIVMI